MSDKLIRRAVFIFRLIDTVKGEACQKFGFRLSFPAGLSPQWKKESGCLVFVGEKRPESGTISLSSNEFTDISEDVRDMPESGELSLLLYPKRSYRPDVNIPCAEGRTEPFALVTAARTQEDERLVLEEDIKAGDDRIGLFCESGISPSAVLISEGKYEKRTHLIRIPEKKDAYRLTEKADADISRKKASIKRLWITRADGDGNFALFFKGVNAGTEAFRAEFKAEKDGRIFKEAVADIKSDGRTSVDLREQSGDY